MTKTKLLALGAEIALIATTVLYRVFRDVVRPRTGGYPTLQAAADGPAVGLGTVRTTDDRHILIEVSSVHGDTFIGRLVHDGDGEADRATLRPGLLVLVAFDPNAREQLSLPDDVLAVRASGLALA